MTTNGFPWGQGLWLLIQSPFKLLAYLFKNKALLVALVVVVLLILGARAIGIGNATTLKTATRQLLPTYLQTAPDRNLAPKALPTSSRVYLVSTFTEDKQTITLTRFYVYNKDKQWQLVTKPLPLDKGLYPGMKLYDR